jgi:hypothetical protein
MNLIGHFACAAALPAAGQLGSVMPDLVTIYDRSLRTPRLLHRLGQMANHEPAAPVVAAGVSFHLTVDRHFHRNTLFTDGYRGIRDSLRQASDTPGLRRMLPAHVLHELFLDHLLLADDPAMAERFYAVVDEHQALIVDSAGLPDQAAAQGLRDFLQRVAHDRFVDDYGDLDGLFYRMNRILARYRQRPLEAAETAAVTDFLEAARPAFAERQRHFVAAMQQPLAASGGPWNGTRQSREHPAARPDERLG